MSRRSGVAVAIAEAGGVGRLPVAPGTWGSAAALLLAWPLAALSPAADAALLLALGAVAVAAADAAARRFRHRDPSRVVIDEVFGMALVLAGWPGTGWRQLVPAFLAFRLFDVLKPPPLRVLERLPGGWGIVADDAGAALYALLLLRLLA